MEEKKIMSAQIKGILISLVIIILGIIGYYTELSFTTWFGWVINALFFVGIIIACIHYGNEKQGYVTFGNVFLHGFKATAVVTVLLLIYTLLAMTVLFPDMKERIFDMQQRQMEERGMDEDQIETAMNFTRKNFMIFMVIFLIFGNLIFGCVASLIGGAFAKKNKTNPLEQFPQ